MSPDVEIAGSYAPGFEEVAEEFAHNFRARDELGAAFAVVVDGTLVVDLWGGIADAADRTPWAEDTLQLIFSGTKGMTATCLLMLVDRGQLDLDAPVARYWPEFAAAGKQAMFVRDVVSHQARLPGLAGPLALADVLDGRRVAERLAAQAPFDDPRARGAYHPLTFGWLCGELLHRIDGRSLGTFFADEVARPLGLELWIGLPSELEGRVSTLELARGWNDFAPDALSSDPLLAATYANPPFADEPLAWNSPPWHAAEMPGANAIGTARSIARFYGCLARGGELDGVRLLSERSLRLGRRRLVDRLDPLTQGRFACGAGFMLQTELRNFGPPGDAFGHSGMGGSHHAAWPTQRAGFSYAMNRLRNDALVDPRSSALLAALFAAMG